MSAGEIVGIVEDRCVEDPIYKLPTTGRADAAAVAPCGADLGRNGPLTAESMVSAKNGHTRVAYPCPANAASQKLLHAVLCLVCFTNKGRSYRGQNKRNEKNEMKKRKTELKST